MTLELNGKQERANVKVEGNKAKCVNSTDTNMKNMEGKFEAHPQQPGVFRVSFLTPKGYMSQIWIVRSDGAVAIREIPDRGEQQGAVPVTGTSIEPPKAR